MTYNEIVDEMRAYAKEMEPVKDRFYDFISENNCSDLPMVPGYALRDYLTYYFDDGTSESRLVPKEKFRLTFPQFPELNTQDSFADENLIEGAIYEAEIVGYDYSDYRSFVIPNEYITDPDGWEEEVLKQIEVREMVADLVASQLFPDSPKEIREDCYFAMDEEEENPQLIVTFNSALLPKEGEPGYLKFSNYDNSVLVEIHQEVLTSDDPLLTLHY